MHKFTFGLLSIRGHNLNNLLILIVLLETFLIWRFISKSPSVTLSIIYLSGPNYNMDHLNMYYLEDKSSHLIKLIIVLRSF